MISAVVEGRIDTAVVTKIAKHVGLSLEQVIPKGARSQIAKKVAGYFRSAHGCGRWIVLADLDGDCPVELLKQWSVPSSSPYFVCRFASQEIEAWLLADRNAIADALKVAVKNIPDSVDVLRNPKRALINAARKSRAQKIRTALVPPNAGVSETGPLYHDWAVEFVQNAWDPVRASVSSPSLDRCIRSMKQLVD